MTSSPKPIPGAEPEYLPDELLAAPDRFVQGFTVGVVTMLVTGLLVFGYLTGGIG